VTSKPAAHCKRAPMPANDLESYKQLPSLGPSAVVELHGLHLHRHLPKSPITIETEKGERRISKPLMPLARKAHTNLLAGADCPEKGPLKAVLQALAGDDASEADTASQVDEGEGAAEALCGRLATEALDRVEAMLLKAVRARYASEKERMVEMALQTVAEEG
jgi:hypothetical protein